MRGAVTSADVVLPFGRDHVELIAHELEHVLEQVEGVTVKTSACRADGPTGEALESCRAVEMGRRVAREVSEARLARTQAKRR
jgi:hypothetical protein